jgi:hypothetical protein
VPTESNNQSKNRHITNEELVAYLDGELDSSRRQVTDEHLATCWHCRAKRSALQARMDEVARASKEFQLAHAPEIGRVPVPRQVLALGPERPPKRFRFAWLTPALAAGAAIAFFALRPAPPAPTAFRPAPAAPTRAAIAASEDIAPSAKAARQRFAVELFSRNRRARHKLEIWSDARRSALRLQREDGDFVHARWQENGKTVADRGVAGRPIQVPSQCRAWNDVESLVSGLLRSQPAGRLRLATGLFRELERRGFRLDAAPTQHAGIWRLEATSRDDRAWLDIDAHSLRPYLFSLASRDEKSSWRIVLRLESEELVEARAVPAYAFTPDPAPAALVAKLDFPPAATVQSPPVTGDLELRILAFAARWRMAGESIRAFDTPAFGVQATVRDDSRRAELERFFETWPLLSFRIEAQQPDRHGPWCAETLRASTEAAQHSWFLTRIESPRYALLESGAGKLRDSIAAESLAGFQSAVAQLDRALRPIRGSSPSALALFRDKEEALSRLQEILDAACGAHAGDTLPHLSPAQRGDILALLAAAQQFQWTLPSSATPSANQRNEP